MPKLKTSARPLPRPRGRPPSKPVTTLAAWLQARGISIATFAQKLVDIAPSHGVRPEDVVDVQHLGKICRGRHWPNVVSVLLIREATEKSIDVQHWVRDLYA